MAANAREHQPGEHEAPRFYANIFHPIGKVHEVTFVLRTSGSPSAIVSAVRQSVKAIDPSLPILSLTTVDEQLDRLLVSERLVAQLSVFFGVVALSVALIGLYGVMSYSITCRTGEIGVRMSLGASKSRVVWMVLSETLLLVALGIAIGLPCAIALGGFIKSRLFGLSAADPAAIAISILIILITTGVAGYLPARRASSVDPMLALRHD